MSEIDAYNCHSCHTRHAVDNMVAYCASCYSHRTPAPSSESEKTVWMVIPDKPSPLEEVRSAVIERAQTWRKHHVCCPKDCPDLHEAQRQLGDALDALAALDKEAA